MFEAALVVPAAMAVDDFCTIIPQRVRARHLRKVVLQVGWLLKATSTVMCGHISSGQ